MTLKSTRRINQVILCDDDNIKKGDRMCLDRHSHPVVHIVHRSVSLIIVKFIFKHILITLLTNLNQIKRKSNECNYGMICIQIKTLF